LRLPIIKVLCRLLYAEARRTGNPIVYLGHPAEFGPQRPPRQFRWSDLSPATVRTHGLRMRKNLFANDREARLDMTRGLISYMGTLPGVHFMTMREYLLNYQTID
jgi:hypothetical protein